MSISDEVLEKWSKGENEGKITHKEFTILNVRENKKMGSWELDLGQKHDNGKTYYFSIFGMLEDLLKNFE